MQSPGRLTPATRLPGFAHPWRTQKRGFGLRRSPGGVIPEGRTRLPLVDPFPDVGRSSARLVPVTLAGHDGSPIAGEAMLEKVEDGELVARHDVGSGLRLNLGPDVRESLLEDLADGRILSTVWALSGNLEGLGDGGVLLALQAGRGVAATHTNVVMVVEEGRLWLAVRHGSVGGVVDLRRLDILSGDGKHCT